MSLILDCSTIDIQRPTFLSPLNEYLLWSNEQYVEKNSIALALSLSLSGHVAATEMQIPDDKTNLGTFRENNSGISVAYGVSADGSVVVGSAVTNTNSNAFIWRSTNGLTNIGTLAADNRYNSVANGVSADGNIVVGQADTSNGYFNAFIWRDSDTKMTSFGTLKVDNSGYSKVNAVSADGRVVVGSAATDSGNSNAFI